MKTPSPERLKRGRAAVIGCSRTDCRICIEVCPFLAVSAADGAPYSDPDKCVGCGGCAAACPDSAIRLVRDRGDGSAELTYPFDGELPEIGAGVTVHPLSLIIRFFSYS